jgi:hypothetical protein
VLVGWRWPHLQALASHDLDGQVIADGSHLLEEDNGPVAALACRDRAFSVSQNSQGIKALCAMPIPDGASAVAAHQFSFLSTVQQK